MPRKSDEAKAETKIEVPLTAYSVVINGTDRTIYATDDADLQAKIEKARAELK